MAWDKAWGSPGKVNMARREGFLSVPLEQFSSWAQMLQGGWWFMGQAGRTPWVECWGRETWDRWPQDVGQALNLWEPLILTAGQTSPRFYFWRGLLSPNDPCPIAFFPLFSENPNSLSLGQSSRDSSFLVGMQMICSWGKFMVCSSFLRS